MMKISGYYFTLLTAAFFLISHNSTWASQVMTEETRKWAKEAIEQEKSLETVSMPNTLAILNFNNRTNDPQFDLLQKGFTLMLTTDLSKVDKIQMVERIKVQAVVDELELGESGIVARETTSRLGKLLGVEYLVGGNIMKTKDNLFRISSHFLEVRREKLTDTPEIEGKLFDDLLRLEKEILFSIIELLNIELSSKQRTNLQKPISSDINALLNLFQGVEKSDLGNYKEAQTYYEKAAEEDPELSLANEAIDEIKDLGLKKGKKGIPDILKSQRGRTSLTDDFIPQFPQKKSRSPKDMDKTCDVRIDWGSVPGN